MSSRRPATRLRYLKSCVNTLLLLLALPAGLAHALPDDRDQPIHITADKALRDEKKGFTVYSGNVNMTQGSMVLEADKLTIYHVLEEVDKIVAEGNPAKMRQQPKPDKGVVHAHARVIEYFKNEERVHLQTGARIEQDGALVTGNSIDYFIAEELVKAESDQTMEGDQVIVVIPSSVQQDTVIPPATKQPDGQIPIKSAEPTADTPPENTPQEVTDPRREKQQEESGSGATEGE